MLRKILFNTQPVLRHQTLIRCFARHMHTNKAATTAPLQLEQTHIDEAVKLEPTLGIYTSDVWRRAHETFHNHGLDTINFLRIVTGNPAILKRSPQRIVDSIEIWRACQFGEYWLHLLLTKYPQLLDVGGDGTDAHQLLSHIAYLKSRVTTNKNVWKLLMNSPNILAQSEKSLEEKLDYIIDVMRIEVPEIVKSSALALGIDELRCRHMFLTRLGLFKPRALKADPNEPSTNNKLYQITDTSEKTFATKICHITLPEYEVFKELFARELNRKGKRSKQAEEEESSDEDDS
ncbi:LOW QUALITY PROTEIN: transcription termination factor 4, mitochondrial [Drosophila tropicalis]|uniref:LOW QUALITY PROTEIN: transcription termination factor 4, mitochondrial n=1 Tax=Drosophila tropicalis TaxID=46794 RepID=UPI0035AB735D